MENLRLRKILVVSVPVLALLIGTFFPVISKVLDTRRLQETNFELSILEFKGENLSSKVNPAKAFFKYKGKTIPLKIMNKDLDLRIVVELPRFPDDVKSHFLDGELLISGGDINESNPQSFPILLVRQPTANTRLEKINKIISDTSTSSEESELSKQMGQLITRLQNKYKIKKDFKQETSDLDEHFTELSSELNELNISFDDSLEELEEIDRELADLLS
jgi:chaperonin cofactor prefoldin